MIKLNVGHKYATKYSVLKRKEILTLVTTCMNLEDIVQSEISRSQKDKYFMISLKRGTGVVKFREKEKK
jgi:hypothetical protein